MEKHLFMGNIEWKAKLLNMWCESTSGFLIEILSRKYNVLQTEVISAFLFALTTPKLRERFI